jgi:hypothetical protein
MAKLQFSTKFKTAKLQFSTKFEGVWNDVGALLIKHIGIRVIQARMPMRKYVR